MGKQNDPVDRVNETSAKAYPVIIDELHEHKGRLMFGLDGLDMGNAADRVMGQEEVYNLFQVPAHLIESQQDTIDEQYETFMKLNREISL